MMREKSEDAFCGEHPESLETTDPRMLLVFNTTGTGPPGRGFKATYEFVTGLYMDRNIVIFGIILCKLIYPGWPEEFCYCPC